MIAVLFGSPDMNDRRPKPRRRPAWRRVDPRDRGRRLRRLLHRPDPRRLRGDRGIGVISTLFIGAGGLFIVTAAGVAVFVLPDVAAGTLDYRTRVRRTHPPVAAAFASPSERTR